eukprot:scaffold112618_cov30-Tisochrysis_lutea.AAC.2
MLVARTWRAYGLLRMFGAHPRLERAVAPTPGVNDRTCNQAVPTHGGSETLNKPKIQPSNSLAAVCKC